MPEAGRDVLLGIQLSPSARHMCNNYVAHVNETHARHTAKNTKAPSFPFCGRDAVSKQFYSVVLVNKTKNVNSFFFSFFFLSGMLLFFSGESVSDSTEKASSFSHHRRA